MRMLIALASLLVSLFIPLVASAETTPTSPGACHMLDANSLGLAGMDGSQGGKNMVPLVVASLGTGCTP